ncbi:MAG: hypothetical protein H0U59_01605, partial [Gemmatimonadaceae bacterium]|nr:hypothetical protein [Gemmatimonadaceae bacterium]
LYTAPASGDATDTVTARAQGSLSGQVSGSASVNVGQQPAQSIFTSESDIGSPGQAGSYTYANGSYSVQGGGSDIWNWSDQFHYVYRQLSGDGTIIARVTGVQNTHPYAKAGVMFRETLAPESKQAAVVLKPDNQLSLQRRTATWGDTLQTPWQASAAPYWLKLDRTGSTFTAFSSSDGLNWTVVGSDTISMGATAYVGLAVTSHDNAVLNTSTFSNVSVIAGTSSNLSAAMTTSASSSRAPGSGSVETSTATGSSSTSTPIVKVNVPLVTGAGKVVVKKAPSVRVNVPVMDKPKGSDVPEVNVT